jgi:hypothetical protein
MTRPFADWLREQSNGRTHDELSEALADVTQAVTDTGKKGTLTLTVTIAPVKNGGGALVVSDAVKTAAPKPDRRTSVFYSDINGNLTREDPRQPTFEGLREVPNPDLATATTTKEKQA